MIDLEPSEIVIGTARKHWFIFVVEIFFILAAAVIPLLIVFFFADTLEQFVLEPLKIKNLDQSLLLFGYWLWLLILWIVMALIWTDYYLDVWYLTNQRIIAVEQRGLFHRKISTFRLEMIQDTTIEIPGILATLIGYGNLQIQTAGQNEKFTIRGVNRPQRVNEIITREYHRAREALREVRIAADNSTEKSEWK
ncbi:MAG: PH domain-containing protein [Patescibacteria group bacterium]